MPGRCQASIAQGKAEAPVAVTHLAQARSRKTGGVILGIQKKRAALEAALYYENPSGNERMRQCRKTGFH